MQDQSGFLPYCQSMGLVSLVLVYGMHLMQSLGIRSCIISMLGKVSGEIV